MFQSWFGRLRNSLSLTTIINGIGVSKRTVGDLSAIFSANAINNGVNFLSNVLIARLYGHEIYGRYAIATNIAFTALILSEFGMNLTMVRLYKAYHGDANKEKATLLLNFYFKLAILIIIVFIGMLVSERLSSILFHESGALLITLLALATGGLLNYWSYLKAYYQAVDQLRMLGVMTYIYSLTRFLLILTLMLASWTKTAENLFVAIYVIPLIAVLVLGMPWRDLWAYHAEGIDRKNLAAVGSEIIGYSKWVAIGSICFALMQKSLVLMVAGLGSVTQASLVSVGVVFTGIFVLINDSIRQVLFPKISSLRLDQLAFYKKRVLKLLPLYIVCSFALILVVAFLMPIILGQQFMKALPLFVVLALGTSATTALGFFTVVLHSLRKPHIDAYINLSRLVVFLLVGPIAVTTYGAWGVVVVFTVSIVLGELIMTFIVGRYVNAVAI